MTLEFPQLLNFYQIILNPGRRGELLDVGNGLIWVLLPALLKNKMRIKGVHKLDIQICNIFRELLTQFLRDSFEGSKVMMMVIGEESGNNGNVSRVDTVA